MAPAAAAMPSRNAAPRAPQGMTPACGPRSTSACANADDAVIARSANKSNDFPLLTYDSSLFSMFLGGHCPTDINHGHHDEHERLQHRPEDSQAHHRPGDDQRNEAHEDAR